MSWLFFRKAVFLTLMGVLANALACAVVQGEPASGGQNPIRTFEQTPVGYIWRTSEVIARFSERDVIIASPGGGQIHLCFPGARMDRGPLGEGRLMRRSFYHLGARETWRTNFHFERLRYKELYPGIDVVFVTNSGHLEYNFEVAAGADTTTIRIRYDGATVSFGDSGDLNVQGAGLSITQRHPQAFQTLVGPRQPVPCWYRIESDHEASIEIGSYDHTAPLLIDPVLNFSTYLGGNGFDAIYAATTDAAGNLYITGETGSTSISSPLGVPRGSRDAFIAKLDSAGTQVVFAVYIGGAGTDSGKAIALDPLGNIYVTGVTSSTDFPVTNGALSTHGSGAEDAFVLKLNPNGGLIYSTYLGGVKPDFGLALAVDATGAAYIAGQTESSDFPVTAGVFQTSYRGGISDCFISKLNPAGSALTYSTRLGGSGLDMCAGIAVDAAGSAYVTGTTFSIDFPMQGPLQSSLRGTANVFVTKFNPSASSLIYSTYVGGSGNDGGTGIAVDSSGAAYVTGNTSSVDFPATAGAVQTVLKGAYNAFVSKLSADGATLMYSTLIGGSGSDSATSIAVDPLGRAIVDGYTTSPDFPVVGAVQSAFHGLFDAFAIVLEANGGSLVFSSYFGGSGDDRAYGVAATTANKLYLAGITTSSNFPTAAPFQDGMNQAPDTFVLEVNYVANVTANSVLPNSGSGVAQAFALQLLDSFGAANLRWVWVWFNSTLSSTASNSCMVYYDRAANQANFLNDEGTAWTPATPGAATILQNRQCSLNVAASSATLTGNVLTLNLAMTFKSGFNGSKNIYIYGEDVSGVNTGWQQRGTWSVPVIAATVTADSTFPSSGSGSNQTFALQYSDSAGAASLRWVWVWFNPILSGTALNSCMLYYDRAANRINFLNEPAWLGLRPLRVRL
jgi:beta-propeller repeat-containing protein